MPKPGNKSGSSQGQFKLFHDDMAVVCDAMRDGKIQTDLIFADPPFNFDLDYDADFDDKKRIDEYWKWTVNWLQCCKDVINPIGTFWVACPPVHQARIRILAESVGFLWRDTVVWHYTFGPHQKGKLTPSWVALHYFTAHRNRFTWNRNECKVPSARQEVYGDKRAKPGGKTPDNVWILRPSQYSSECFLPDQNVQLASRVCGTFKDRKDHPCQMPVAVLDRIVRLTSSKGDLVFDPFLGSGTTGEAALRAGRKFVGCDISEKYVNEVARPRLESIP